MAFLSSHRKPFFASRRSFSERDRIHSPCYVYPVLGFCSGWVDSLRGSLRCSGESLTASPYRGIRYFQASRAKITFLLTGDSGNIRKNSGIPSTIRKRSSNPGTGSRRWKSELNPCSSIMFFLKFFLEEKTPFSLPPC
jgi:hypothetical protein